MIVGHRNEAPSENMIKYVSHHLLCQVPDKSEGRVLPQIGETCFAPADISGYRSGRLHTVAEIE